MLRQRENERICWEEKKKTKQQLKQTIQLEEINQKIQIDDQRKDNPDPKRHPNMNCFPNNY